MTPTTLARVQAEVIEGCTLVFSGIAGDTKDPETRAVAQLAFDCLRVLSLQLEAMIEGCGQTFH